MGGPERNFNLYTGEYVHYSNEITYLGVKITNGGSHAIEIERIDMQYQQ